MLVGLYGWIGNEIPNPEIAESLEFIPVKDYIPHTARPMDFSILGHLSEERQNVVKL